MSNRRKSILFAVIVLCMLLAAVAVQAQTTNSCLTSGYTGFRYTTVYNAGANTTTYTFTFCNLTPVDGVYVNIGAVFFFGLPAPTSTTAPTGWAFFSPGQKLSFQTTSNPWWKTPPAIKPGDCLNSFTYTISGTPDTTFDVVMHVQNVTDATGQTAGALGTWFDCSVLLPPIEQEPCINVVKSVTPGVAAVGDTVTYSVVVSNCGDVDLDVTALADDNPAIGSLLDEFIAANGNSSILPVGASVTITYEYTVTGSETNPFNNCVSVTGEYDTSSVTDTDCASLAILTGENQPSISIEKTAFPTVANVGTQVAYQIKVCNTGNVDLFVDTLTDNILGDLYDDFFAANGNSNSLPVGACVTFTVYYTIKASDTTPLLNCVTVTAEDDEQEEVEDTACARVDIGNPTQPRCYLPVTFTVAGWKAFCDPLNPILAGGVVYNRFPIAFSTFTFYNTILHNKVEVGLPGKNTLAFTGTTFGLTLLCNFFPQVGGCGRLYGNYTNPQYIVNQAGIKTQNVLAAEALALTMNIAYNDMRVMPRTPGYDLEKFTITQGIFKGRTVGYVLDLANKVLGGTFPAALGLTSCDDLATVLMNINANYEFVDFKTFNDKGYLKPNRVFGQPDPPHAPVVP